jgi:hypothetical protein
MKSVVYETEVCGFRNLGVSRGVENVGYPSRVDVSVIGHPNLEGRQ